MAQDVETAKQWLREHPNHADAATVRANLRAAGESVDEPQESSGLATTARLAEQAWLLDPIEAVGQMVGMTGENLPEWMRSEAAAAKEASARHPYWHTALSIANPAFLAAPELGIGRVLPALGSAARGAFAGGVASVLQPVDDPQDPHFWRQKAQQGLLGTVTGGTLGRMAGAVDARAAAASKAASDYARDVNAANAANLQAQAARTMGVRQDAADYGQKIRDFLAATQRQAGAQAAHTTAVADQARRASAAATKHAQDIGDVAVETGRLQAQHATELQDYAAAVASREGLNARKNVEWYSRVLEPLGLQHLIPAQPGSAALAQLQRIIGDRLNAANRQFTLTRTPVLNDTLAGHYADGMIELQNQASRDRWSSIFKRRVSDPLNAELTGGAPLKGDDFARYITSINREADRLARGATRVNPNAVDDLAMADALHRMTAEIEGAADGPFLARQERIKAREAYSRWSILSGAAEPEKGGIASAQEVIQHWSQRQGSHDRYNRDLASNPDKQFLEQWRLEATSPKPERPPEPTLPQVPKAPKVEKPLKEPKAARETPTMPQPPKDRPPAARPGVFPPEPKPPGKEPPGWAARTGRAAAHIGLGEAVHQLLGIPRYYAWGATIPTLEAILQSEAGKKLLERGSRFPATGGAAAGNLPDVSGISSVIPGL